MSQTYLKLLHFLMKLDHFRVQNHSQSGPKSLPKWSKIEVEAVLQPQNFPWLGTQREIIIGNDFGSDLGAVWGLLLDPKSISEAILQAVARGSVVPTPKK